ncbi:hypothetical protein AVEN_139408-1 [Araneus ventricosus]|uniref:Uncharacterized protein n=1 Tax=Araneus ventricosus TaxID=182803 RepID=A0A4Y2QBN2_ARAVE|nr:hypothetical protein AVEN_139408-1 [Araneus ventricosus]
MYLGGISPSYPKGLVTPVVTKVLAAVRTLDRFGISDRAGAAIVSAPLQDVGIISESIVLNVVDGNKIRRGRTKARTSLLSQSVIKDYDHGQFGLYFDGRKDRTLSMEDNRRKVIIEEHISLAKEPGSEYIGHVSWENVIEPPLTERFSDDKIAEAIVNPAIIYEAMLPTIKGFPCHPQATERIVKVVTEAAAAVC